MTRLELGGSHWALVQGQDGGPGPAGRPRRWAGRSSGPSTPRSRGGLVRRCHDLSEGGLAVALAEMALAGGLGAGVSLRDVPCDDDAGARRRPAVLGIALAVPARSPPRARRRLADLFGGLPLGRLGEVVAATRSARTPSPRLTVLGLDDSPVIDAPVADLKAAWQRPLRW